MFIRDFAESCCDECRRVLKGVRFTHKASEAFLCWEHFRLAAPLLERPEPALIRETVIRCCGRCHCSCSRHSLSRPESWSSSEGRSVGESNSWSEGSSP